MIEMARRGKRREDARALRKLRKTKKDFPFTSHSFRAKRFWSVELLGGGLKNRHVFRKMSPRSIPAHRRCAQTARILAGGETTGDAAPAQAPHPERVLDRIHDRPSVEWTGLLRRCLCHDFGPAPLPGRDRLGLWLPVVSPPANIRAHLRCAGSSA